MRLKQGLFVVLAALLFALGVLGVFLPLLPTTPFMLAAVALASKGSPRFAAWIRANRYAGPALRDWEREGAISRRAKALAVAMIATSAALTWWHIDYRPLAIGVIVMLCGVTLFLLSRPGPGARTGAASRAGQPRPAPGGARPQHAERRGPHSER